MAAAATANASATRNATFWPLARMPSPIAEYAEHHRGDAGDPHLLVLGHLAFALMHARVDVVCERRRRGDGQAGDDGQDGRERHRRDDAEQDHAAELEGQQRRGRVLPAGRGEDPVRADERRRAVPEHQGEQVERTDQRDRPDHRTSGLLGGGHGVEAHQHVRQARGAEHQRERQRDEVDLRRSTSRRTARPAPARRGWRRPRVVASETAVCAEPRISEKFRPNLASTITVMTAGADDQQHGLDDLHPGGALHAADQDVDDHQDADDRDHDRLARAGCLTSSSSATSPPAPAICASR